MEFLSSEIYSSHIRYKLSVQVTTYLIFVIVVLKDLIMGDTLKKALEQQLES